MQVVVAAVVAGEVEGDGGEMSESLSGLRGRMRGVRWGNGIDGRGSRRKKRKRKNGCMKSGKGQSLPVSSRERETGGERERMN